MKPVELGACVEIGLVQKHLIDGTLKQASSGLKFDAELVDEGFKPQITSSARCILPVSWNGRGNHHEIANEEGEGFSEDQVLFFEPVELSR